MNGRGWEWADKRASFSVETMPMPREPLPRWRWVGTGHRASAEHPGTGFYAYVFPLKGPQSAFLRSYVSSRKGPSACGFWKEAPWLFGWATAGCPGFPQLLKRQARVFTQWPQCTQRTRALSYTANSWLWRGCVLGAETRRLQ